MHIQKLEKLKETLKPFKLPIIVLVVIGVLFLILNVVMPFIDGITTTNSPIVEIKAKNEKSYISSEVIRENDFEVHAIHENGEKHILDSNEFTISDTTPGTVGKTKEIEVVLKENKKIRTKVLVKNERKKIISFECGSPNIKDARAIVYSNGELAFEGSGNILQFEKRSFPWQLDDSYAIKSVTFEKDITPKIMDYWFEGMPYLEYIAPLPKTVESVVGMCKDCESFEEGVDWSNCSNLSDISYLYQNCINLASVPEIPDSVKNATGFCSDCHTLSTTPDMTKATNLTNATEMFYNCKKLTKTTSAPSIEIYSRMYENCINLKDMPVISNNAKILNNTFKNCTSLSTLTEIPENVEDVSGCFTDCRKISGELVINANPGAYGSFLYNAASATTLNLTGNCSHLDALANTNNGNNVLVNGAQINRNAVTIH